MAEKSPSFQLYPRDFLADGKVQIMGCDEVGAYFLLLMYQWLEGAVPTLPADWAPVCRVPARRMAAMQAHLEPCFPVGEDGLRRNRRLEKVRADQVEYRRRQSEKAKARWDVAAMPRHTSGISREVNLHEPECGVARGAALPDECSASASASAFKKGEQRASRALSNGKQPSKTASAKAAALAAWREACGWVRAHARAPLGGGDMYFAGDKMPDAACQAALESVGGGRLFLALTGLPRELGFVRREFLQAFELQSSIAQAEHKRSS